MKSCSKCGTKYDDGIEFCPRDGRSLVENSSELAVGRILDDQYEIEAFIARGGMGTVYRARHTLLGDRVAVKILRPEMRDNEEWLQRFLREGQVARRFRHPNAVTVYDLRATDDNLIYMAMEYVEGLTLDAELKKRGRFTPAEALRVLEPVADVLDAAHKKGIVHRDLKPENVMLEGAAANSQATSDVQNIKLLDLGIAKMTDAASGANPAASLTLVGQILGTPYYMSPEQWGELPRDGVAEIDGRTDIYSFGVMLYELVSGAKPFDAKSLGKLRRAHTSLAPRPLHEVVPGVSLAFSSAVMRALAKDRADRFSTAGELIAKLKIALAETPPANAPLISPNAPTLIQSGKRNSAASPARDNQNQPRGAAPPAFPQPRARASNTSDSSTGNAHTSLSYPAQTAPQLARNSNPFAASFTQSSAMPASSKRALALTFLAATLGLFLIFCIAVGGWFVWLQTRGETVKDGNQNYSNGIGAEGTNATGVEALRYWLDIYPPLVFFGEHERIAGAALKFPGGRQAKFHVVSRADGYLYIIAPNERQQMTAYLTSQLVPGLELASNKISANTDFAFPGGNASISIDTKPSTGTMTLIFSPTPLTSPSFLNLPSTRVLSANELAELEAFRRANKDRAPLITVENEEEDESKPYAAVKVPGTTINAGKPVVVNIALQNAGT